MQVQVMKTGQERISNPELPLELVLLVLVVGSGARVVHAVMAARRRG